MTIQRRSIRRLLTPLLPVPALLACGSSTVASAPSAPTAETLRLFDYDAKAPLDIQFVSMNKEGAITIQELTYTSPKGGRVPATLVIPDGPGPFAGILLMHGAPGTRAVTLPEARHLARLGAVTLAIDAPFARPGRINDMEGPIRFDERDRDEQIQLIVDLRLRFPGESGQRFQREGGH